MRALVPGGNSGVWGGMFSTCDYAIKGIRQKVDAWNAIGAGFMTGASLEIRGGYHAARIGALRCALLLAVIKGIGIGLQNLMPSSTKLEAGLLPMP
ncbi:Mitochondrial import inner membrane translocase subunit tim17 [Colletotrichum tropicale]|nr:Mitochondrial import inner membrane translocase subunit tim17 [Colletotrichum tropicale]